MKVCITTLLLILVSIFPISAAENPNNKKINYQAFHLCELAVQVASEKNYDAAIIYLKRALEIEPKFTDALFNLGSIYRSQKKYNDSYFAFQQLLQINPADHEARLEKTLALIALKDFSAAEKELSKIPQSEKRFDFVQKQLDKNKALYKSEKSALIAEIPKGLYNSSPTQTPVPAKQEINTSNLSFNSPTGIASDNDENIYIANFSTNTIEKISPEGKRQIIVQGDLVSGPSDIIFDQKSHSLLIANYKSGNITSLDLANKTAKIIIDNLKKPYALFLKQDRKLYISEQGRQAISIIDISNY